MAKFKKDGLMQKLATDYRENGSQEAFADLTKLTKPIVETISFNRFMSTSPDIDLDSIKSFGLEGVFHFATTDLANHKNSSEYDGPKPYLIGCVNHAITWGIRTCFYDLRSKKGRTTANVFLYYDNRKKAEGMTSNIDPPEIAVQKRDTAERLANILYEDLSLSKRDINIVYLRYVERLHQREIGERVNLSRNSIDTILASINKKLASEACGDFSTGHFIKAIQKRYQANQH